jgi:sugar phosphate isomerase/epimerase
MGGLQYDVRHAVAESQGVWAVAMKLIAPYIRSTCLKDFVWAKPKGKWIPDNVFAGEGMVPWDKYFTLLKELKIGGPPRSTASGSCLRRKSSLCLRPSGASLPCSA